jgi:hypothetical protein
VDQDLFVVTVTTPEFDSTQNSLHLGTNYKMSQSSILKIQLSKYSMDESEKFTTTQTTENNVPYPAQNGDDLSTGSFSKNPGKDINVISMSIDTVF